MAHTTGMQRSPETTEAAIRHGAEETTQDGGVSAAAVLDLLRQLSPRDQLWVMARALPYVERDLPYPGPRKSALGMLAHLGPAPSAEEIDEARREMWSSASHSEP